MSERENTIVMRIYAPDGSIGSDVSPLAETPDVLSGRRIAVLDNGKPGAATLISRLAEQLGERTGAVFVGVHRKGSAATPCEDELLRQLTEVADLVLTGTAD
jgi:hypothetical protein